VDNVFNQLYIKTLVATTPAATEPGSIRSTGKWPGGISNGESNQKDNLRAMSRPT